MEKHTQHHVGFISTRLAGTDGVSLEVQKWAHIFEREGLPCFYMAGEIDRRPERSFLVEKAHFNHPEILEINQNCFGVDTRKPQITRKIHDTKRELKEQIYAFIEKFQIDLLIPQNALSIPMNIPLGIAITEVISETGIRTIAHHHDFFWERQRFLRNAVQEYLNMAFPPDLPSIRHVVINSTARHDLSSRVGISSTLVPNIMEFEKEPPSVDEYAADIRHKIGLDDDELLILQPTRIVARKGIEYAIELTRRLGMKATLIIPHASRDEGGAYERRIREFADFLGVKLKLVSEIVGEFRQQTMEGKKIYSLADIYPYADLVTYPSIYEGFGNAFLEAIYYRKPIVVNNYSVYSVDIKPKGFQVIEFDGFVTEEAVEHARQVLSDPDLRKRMADRNYELALQYYSYSVLGRKLKTLLMDCFGE
jgi:glycosyltransferase involved in cell wall biosynthesis